MVEEAAYGLLAACLGFAGLVSAFAPSWRRARGRGARRSRSARPAPAVPLPAIERRGQAGPARVHVMLGEMALQARDRDRALQHFRRALALDPTLGLRRTIEKLESPPTLRRVA